jgi:intraflagellar transport protein 52
MRGADGAKSAFNDPTRGGAVPAGREGAPSVVFSACKGETFHPGSSPSGYKQWFRRLRASFRPSVLKPPASPGAPAITPESLEGADVLVFGAPREKFTVEEFDALKDFIHDGGGVLILAHEGGEEALGTNLNYLIEEYGMSVNADALVRTAHQTYFHPKEALVTDGVLNRAVTQYAERGGERARRNKKGSDGSRGDPLNDSTNDDDPASSASPSGGGTAFAGSSGGEENRPVAFVMPHAATLNVQKPATAVLSSGKACYPTQRPVAAAWRGNKARGEGAGRVAVLGSGAMADDEWLDREDNAKVLDFFLRWLCPDSSLALYQLDAEEPDVSEYARAPDTEALAERPRACLRETEDLPKDFSALFDDAMYAMDTDLVPEAVELYEKLGVKKQPLALIAPSFEAPLPRPKPAVFPPALREPPPPALDLFDLEDEFASEKTRLAGLLARCRASAGGAGEDVETFVAEGARICGVAEGDAKSALAEVFRRIVQLKMRDDGGRGNANTGGGRRNADEGARLDRIEGEIGGMTAEDL